MKKILLLVVLSTLLSSCGLFKTYSTFYDVNLIKVTNLSDSTIGQNYEISKTERDKYKFSVYDDKYIGMDWNLSGNDLKFALRNNSGKTITVLWDDIAYINEQKATDRVIHKGILFEDSNQPQKPTPVPNHTMLGDYLIPVSTLYRVWDGDRGTWEWRRNTIFPMKVYRTQEEADNCPMLGKTLKVLFPILIGTEKNEYLFEFRVDAVVAM